MADREPLDPAVPYNQLAEIAKQEVAEAGIRIMASPEYRRMNMTSAGAEATIAGVFVGAVGIAMAHFETADEAQRELLALLTAYLPEAFDLARSVHGLPPLAEDH